jgi:hypothetical protein
LFCVSLASPPPPPPPFSSVFVVLIPSHHTTPRVVKKVRMLDSIIGSTKLAEKRKRMKTQLLYTFGPASHLVHSE